MRRNGHLNLKERANVRSDLFSQIDSNEAWLLGLYWSDGCIYKNRLLLTSKDLSMLEIVERLMKGKRCIKKRKNQNAYDLAFSNKSIADRLREIGLHENKSHTIKWPKGLSKELEWDFIRGVFDGDGCVYNQCNNRVPLLNFNIVTASCVFLNELKDRFAEKSIPFSIHKSPSKNGMIGRISVGYKGSCIIYKLFYDDENKPCLKRKYEIFKNGVQLKRPKIGRPVGIPNKKKYANQEFQIINYYINIGKTLQATATEFNLSDTTILNILKSHKIKTYSGRSVFDRLGGDIKENIIQDREKGHKFKDLQDKYGLGRNIIRMVLNE
jgi:hypothetical protein